MVLGEPLTNGGFFCYLPLKKANALCTNGGLEQGDDNHASSLADAPPHPPWVVLAALNVSALECL